MLFLAEKPCRPMIYGRHVQCLWQLITHVTTKVSDVERERLPSIESSVCLGRLITLVVIVSKRVLYCLQATSECG